MTSVMDRVNQAGAWLIDEGANLGIPLTIDATSRSIFTDLSAAFGLKQIWICDVFQFLKAAINPNGERPDADGDDICSDDVALLLRRQSDYDHVVISFHVKGNGDTGTIPDVEQERFGPIVVYYYNPSSTILWTGYAHEFLHQFGAGDEYPPATCFCDNAYIHYSYGPISPSFQTNANCTGCADDNQECVMRGGGGYDSICEYTRRQIGWGDYDNDGERDAIDLPRGDRDVSNIGAVVDWMRGSAYGQFLFTDVAGGELQTVPVVDDLGEYSVAGSFPLPRNAQTRLLASRGYLFSITGSADSVYAATCGGSVLGPWRGVGIAPSESGFGAAIEGGFLYIAGGWSDAYLKLKCAPISPSGSLGDWVTITGLPAYTQNITAANGFLYAAWVEGSPYDRWLRVSGARIRPDGTLDGWDSADSVYTSGGSGDGVSIWGIASDGGGLFIVADGEYRDRAISTTINPNDGSRTLPWHNVEIGPTVGRSLSSGSVCSAAGRVFMVGGFQNIEAHYSPIPDVYMGTINPDKAVTSWVRRGDLPFSAGRTGVCVTSDETSMHFWAGGGQVLWGEPPDMLHVAPFLFGDDYPAEARAMYRLPLGAAKNIKSIAWRSTDNTHVALRYRAESGGYFTDWTDFVPASNGRMVPGTPLLTSCLELELIANPQGLTSIHDITIAFTDPNPGSTPSGNSIFATLPNASGQCRFASVIQAGTTDAVLIENPPPPPSGSAVRGAFAITTSALFTGEVEIGLRYDLLAVDSEADLKLLHYDSGQWVDATTHVDPIARLVWGCASSFSMFAIAEDTTTTVTAVRDRPGATPSFTVQQNAPNPFGAMTTIRFGLSRPERVTVRIYDVAGRLVRTLLDEPASVGERVLEWDGRNQAGYLAGSGVYFFKFQAGSHVETRKAVLVR